jgi:hypothetical protein
MLRGVTELEEDEARKQESLIIAVYDPVRQL